MENDSLAGSGVSQVLLYDGVCGFCNGAVQFILRHESRHTLKFAPLQGEFAARVTGRHPALDEIDSLVWLETGADEQVYVRSRAVFRVLHYLGGFWNLLLVFRLVPIPILDFFYDWFARRRYHWFGRHDACPIPEPDIRHRFLA